MEVTTVAPGDAVTFDATDVLVPYVYEPGHQHGLDTIESFVVVETIFGGKADPALERIDRARYIGATSYATAMDYARRIRAGQHDRSGHYAVVDRVHACGCRTIG